MNRKTSWLLIAGLVIISSVIIVSCKKAAETVVNTVDNTNASKAKTQASDASFVNGEADQAENDVHNSVSASARMNPSGSVATSNGVPSNADTAWTANGILTINYHGLIGTCRYRTGSITVQLITGKRWIDSGAVVMYTFNNYKVTNLCNGRSATFNGTRYITNESGGNMYTITLTGHPSSITHKVRANYTVTFTDSGSTTTKTAQWNVARSTTVQYLVGLYSFSTSGDTTLNGVSNVESWGTTRNGDSYTTVFSTPVTSNTYCGLAGIYRPTSGSVLYTVASFPYSIVYGLDAAGMPVSPTSGCVALYYYKVSWTLVSGTIVSALIPY